MSAPASTGGKAAGGFRVRIARDGPRLLLLCALIFIMFVGAWMSWKATREKPQRLESGIYYPTGYTDRIKRMIASGALYFDPASKQLHTALALQEDREWVEAASSPSGGFKRDLAATNAALRDYDLQHPQDNPGLPLWVVNGKPVVEAEPMGISLPSRFVGRVRPCRAPASGAYLLVGPGLGLLIAPGLNQPGRQTVAIWERASSSSLEPDSKFYLKPTPRAPGEYSALLEWRAEDGRVHLEVRGDPALKLRVNGQPARTEAVLAAGDLIAFEHGVKRANFVFLNASAPAAAAVGALVGDDAHPFKALAGAPDASYRILDRQRAMCSTPEVRAAELEPTLHSALQFAVQGALEAKIEEMNRSVAAAYRGEPASVLLMDALTGDVLVKASWPSPVTALPAGLPLRNQPAFRKRQQEDGNFKRHIIGSAGKPFWVAAVWDLFPALRDLEVGRKNTTSRDRIETTLGLTFGNSAFPQKFPGELGARPMDRHWFFAHSTNTWFMDLMLLSLAMRPDAAGAPKVDLTGPAVESLSGDRQRNLQTVRLGGQPLTHAPRLNGDFIDGTVVKNFEDFAVTRKLAAAFSLIVADPPSPRMDLSVIDAVIQQASEKDRKGKFYNYQLAPEAPYLDFKDVKSIYPDLTSHLLGGGSGQWTNVKLAEAIARLGTERRVSARLVRLAGVPPTPVPELTELQPETRRVLRECLQGATNTTVQDFGDTTAHQIESIIRGWNKQPRPPRPAANRPAARAPATPAPAPAAASPVFRCYSKTGTAYFDDADAKNGVDSGNYVFCLSLETPDGRTVRAVSGAIFVQRRGSSIRTAVPIAARIFPLLKQLYFDAPSP